MHTFTLCRRMWFSFFSQPVVLLSMWCTWNCVRHLHFPILPSLFLISNSQQHLYLTCCSLDILSSSEKLYFLYAYRRWREASWLLQCWNMVLLGVMLRSMRSNILKEPDASVFRVYSARFYLPSAFCYVVPMRRVHFMFLFVTVHSFTGDTVVFVLT